MFHQFSSLNVFGHCIYSFLNMHCAAVQCFGTKGSIGLLLYLTSFNGNWDSRINECVHKR